MDNFIRKIEAELSRQEGQGTLRALSVFKDFYDFASNDYLGLARMTTEIPQKIPTGATGSRLISGNFSEIEKLEQEIAKFHHGKDALLFPSGFQANISLFQAIANRNDIIFYDAESHVSLKAGMRLAFAKKISFPHNNTEKLEEKLKKVRTTGEIFLVLEALYSMSGDAPDWEHVKFLQKKYNLLLIIDEAHSGGVCFRGKGIAALHSLRPLISVFTYGKAFGFQGASYVLPTKSLKSYLLNKSYGFIYSTGLSPRFVEILKVKYKQIKQADEQREKLMQNIRFFKRQVARIPYPILGKGPIFAILIPDIRKITKTEKTLLARKFFVKKILAPTVPKGTERLRIVLHSYNTKEEINSLVELLRKNTHG